MLCIASACSARLLRSIQYRLTFVSVTPEMDRRNDAGFQVHPEGKYVVDIDAGIDINKCTPGVRVALRNDSYALHLLLPTKVRLNGVLARRKR